MSGAAVVVTVVAAAAVRPAQRTQSRPAWEEALRRGGAQVW